jgi:WD40 repeat protein
MIRLLLCALFLVDVAHGQNSITLDLPCEHRSEQISPSGKHVAVRCQDRSVHVLEIPGGKELGVFPAKHRYENFDFSRDGKFFGAAGAEGDVEVVSLAVPTQRKQWKTGNTSFDVLKFISNDLVAVAIHARPGEIWDISGTPKKIATLETDFDGLTAIAASPDQQWIIATCADTVVRFYRAPNWNLVGEYRGLTLEPLSAEFTSDGRYAVVGGADRQITLFDPASGKIAKQLPVVADPIQEIHALEADRLAVLYFDAEGRKPPHIKTWQISSGKSETPPMDATVTGGGVVNGKLWFASAQGKNLRIWTAER